ncbi:MAG: hypothetical protein IPM13_18880 [Phycisphaerales bacterium]|nr:hypothetical protein [Phycisphaerales bacterium]
MRARSRVLTVTNLRRFTSIALVWGSLAATARAQEPVDVGKLLAILDANVQRTFTCRHSLVEVLAEDPTRDEEVLRQFETAGTTAPADANFVADYVYTASGSRLVGSFVVHRNALHGEGSAWVSLSDGERTLWVTGDGATVRLYREYNIGGAGCLVTFFLGAWGPDHAATRMRQAIQDGTLRAQRQAVGTITAAMDFREGVGNREVTWELGFDPQSQRVVSVRRFFTDLPDSPKGGFWVATFDPTNGLPRTGWSLAHWGRYTSKRYLRFHRFTYEDLALAPDDVLRLAADVLAGKADDLQGIAPTAYAEHLDAEIQRVASATIDAFPRRPQALAPRLRPEELVWPSLADFRGGREGGDRVDPEAPRTRRAHAAMAFLAGYHTRTSAPLVAAFEMAPSRDLSFAEVPRLAADLGVPLQAVELDAGTASLLTEPFLLSLPASADTPAHIAVGLPRGTAGVRVWRPPGSASEGLAFATTRCLVSPTDLAHLRATQVAQQEAARTAKATSIAVAILAAGAGLALAHPHCCGSAGRAARWCRQRSPSRSVGGSGRRGRRHRPRPRRRRPRSKYRPSTVPPSPSLRPSPNHHRPASRCPRATRATSPASRSTPRPTPRSPTSRWNSRSTSRPSPSRPPP